MSTPSDSINTPSTSTADPSASSTTAAEQPPPPEPYLDQTSGKWMVETADGKELEWDTARNAWVPVVSLPLTLYRGRERGGGGEIASEADADL
jgi:hypothetical protein